MGKRTSYAPGTFSLVDLATTDAAAAKAFYSGMFGWEMEDTDAGGAVYTLCRLDGDAVAGLYAMSEEMRSTGAPPNWLSYVTVADADAAVARVKELGGKADEPMPVPGMGWFVTCTDPHGNEFGLWQNDPSAPPPTG